MDGHSSKARSPRQQYWVRTRRLTLLLLLGWFVGTFGILFFARELSNFTFFGWPLSFYLAAQGMVIAYTVIVAIYAFKMRKLDRLLENKNSNGIQ
ncbi:MAG TPA: sodium/substrate symporter small subunit [Burkholderiaceae bacterium]|nr:sodium/substrate symporter small subunit [Burkholderiaceae bacterium]